MLALILLIVIGLLWQRSYDNYQLKHPGKMYLRYYTKTGKAVYRRSPRPFYYKR